MFVISRIAKKLRKLVIKELKRLRTCNAKITIVTTVMGSFVFLAAADVCAVLNL